MAIVRGHPVNLQQLQPQPETTGGQRFFGALSSGLGDVLAAMQQKKEADYRERQLALQGYNASIQSRQQDLAEAEAERQRLNALQVGGALQRVIGGRPPQAAPPMPGNFTQAGPGLGAPMPMQQKGNQLQASPGFVQSRPPAPRPPGVGEGIVPGQPYMPTPMGMSSATTDPALNPELQGIFHQILSQGASALNPAGLDAHMQAALLGVNPENLPDAIKAVEGVQGLAPTPTAPTGDMQNFATFLQMTGMDARDPRAAYLFWQLIGPKPGTTVNVGGKPSAFDEKWGENQALALGKMKEGAGVALGMFPTLYEAYGLVKNGKVITGFGAKQLLGLARFAKAMGAPIPDDFKLGKDAIADTQTLLRLTGDQVLAYLRSRDLGSGTAVSDGDRNFMESIAGRDITLDKETLQRIMRINIGTGIMKTEDAIRELREQARQNPGSAAKLNADAANLERKMAPQMKVYLQMKASELKADDDIRKQAASVPGFVK